MSEFADSVSGEAFAGAGDGALEGRIFRAIIAIVILAVVASVALMTWRVTAGLALGGALAILNYHWLRTSISTVLSVVNEKRPRLKISRLILRYLVVGAIVFTASWLQFVSLPATIIGLCAFVPALFVEALRQFYFGIIHREGTN